MSEVGQKIAQEAQAWVGTPFVWGQAQKRQGCDCKGLLVGVSRAVGRPEAEGWAASFSEYRRDRKVPTQKLKQGLAELFDPVADGLQSGDVLLLNVAGRAQHIAIVTQDGQRAVHAQGRGAKEWVKETRMEALLLKFPLDSAWRWRED